jgi:hypothetical protein
MTTEPLTYTELRELHEKAVRQMGGSVEPYLMFTLILQMMVLLEGYLQELADHAVATGVTVDGLAERLQALETKVDQLEFIRRHQEQAVARLERELAKTKREEP